MTGSSRFHVVVVIFDRLISTNTGFISVFTLVRSVKLLPIARPYLLDLLGKYRNNPHNAMLRLDLIRCRFAAISRSVWGKAVSKASRARVCQVILAKLAEERSRPWLNLNQPWGVMFGSTSSIALFSLFILD